jgi:hypothetical protein
MLEEAQSIQNKKQKITKKNVKLVNPSDQEEYMLDGLNI